MGNTSSGLDCKLVAVFVSAKSSLSIALKIAVISLFTIPWLRVANAFCCPHVAALNKEIRAENFKSADLPTRGTK